METSVDLNRCIIGGLGARCLSKYLSVDNNLDYVSKITIDLARNEFHEEDILHVARMLFFIEHLYLSHNRIRDTGASLISEAIRETAILKTLILRNCSITSGGAKDLSRALAQNSSLEKFDISGNNLRDRGINHVAEALKQNKHCQLKELWIGQCGMTDKGTASLASALTVNNSLKMLHIGGLLQGALTKDGLSAIAGALTNKSTFVKLTIPFCSTSSVTAVCLSRKVSEARKRNGLPPIEIEGEYIVCCVDVSS
jgi:Ran GTPase-activating protein (RanGAP) involved in mRNA processing and transport